jgi:hypothetical protein
MSYKLEQNISSTLGNPSALNCLVSLDIASIQVISDTTLVLELRKECAVIFGLGIKLPLSLESGKEPPSHGEPCGD